MSFIVRYQKFIDAVRTVEISLPVNQQGQRIGQEIATIDGFTYVSLPNGATLPAQPTEISVQSVTMTPALASQIASASPQVKVINERVVAMIREQYSMDEEIKLLRTAPSEEFEVYNEYVESCRAWGRAQKTELGL